MALLKMSAITRLSLKVHLEEKKKLRGLPKALIQFFRGEDIDDGTPCPWSLPKACIVLALSRALLAQRLTVSVK